MDGAASAAGPEGDAADAALVARYLEHVRSGNVVLEAEDLTVEVAGRTLVRGLTLRLSQGERLGIVGPNGCGKTSLLRVLTGQAPPTAGKVTHGKNTRIAFLDQRHSSSSNAFTCRTKFMVCSV